MKKAILSIILLASLQMPASQDEPTEQAAEQVTILDINDLNENDVTPELWRQVTQVRVARFLIDLLEYCHQQGGNFENEPTKKVCLELLQHRELILEGLEAEARKNLKELSENNLGE